MNSDLLTPSEARHENAFMIKWVMVEFILIGLLWWGYAYSCDYQEPEPIVIKVSSVI